MKNKSFALTSLLFISTVLAFLYFSIMPHFLINGNKKATEFSEKRAFQKVQNIAKTPHFVGSKNHNNVANYLKKELENLGLQASFHEGYTLYDGGYLVNSKSVLAKIKGSDSSKALLLLSHYDSAPHSASFGASDAGSGVATILEGIRAFLHNKTPHKNDIIILFTDAEELGINGAALFASQHPWANQVGLVLNFEARGSSGPSYTLLETTQGNAKLIDGFAKAGVRFPVANSLMYSVYKRMPNYTDLNAFKDLKQIQGFNFAFIDGHYNYHSVQDVPANLSLKSLAHQGSYLMSLLQYFSNSNLANTQTSQNAIYFNVPFHLLHYPFSWIVPLLVLAIILLLLLLFLGFAKKLFHSKDIFKGFVPIFASIFIAVLITFLGWQLLQLIYPQYADFLNGFTYNGHYYIGAFSFLSIGICFVCYHYFSATKKTMNHFVAPLVLWIFLNAVFAWQLPGASYLIIPVYFGLLQLAMYIIFQKNSNSLLLVLSIPALVLVSPFIIMFPVGLGLKVLAGSALLVTLLFGFLLPIFGNFNKKISFAVVFFLLSFGFFVKAHFDSGYQNGKAKSNSLVYWLDADAKKAKWMTYDKRLDVWTQKILGSNPKEAVGWEGTPFFSKYDTQFTFENKAPLYPIAAPSIVFEKDSIATNKRFLSIKIMPNRAVNNYAIFANPKMQISDFTANGVSALDQKTKILQRTGKQILNYYVVDNAPLLMTFTIPKNQVLDLQLLESSYNLLSSPEFKLPKRENWMMPTPFVVNDAIILKKQIRPSIIFSPKPILPAKAKKPKVVLEKISETMQQDSL